VSVRSRIDSSSLFSGARPKAKSAEALILCRRLSAFGIRQSDSRHRPLCVKRQQSSLVQSSLLLSLLLRSTKETVCFLRRREPMGPTLPAHSNSSHRQTPPSALGNVHVARFSQVAHNPVTEAEYPVLYASVRCTLGRSVRAPAAVTLSLVPPPSNSSQNSTGSAWRRGNVQALAWAQVVHSPWIGTCIATPVSVRLGAGAVVPRLAVERFDPFGLGEGERRMLLRLLATRTTSR